MNFGMTEILIVLVIAVVIFGANRLPELGRGIGKGIRNFKDATREATADDSAARRRPRRASAVFPSSVARSRRPGRAPASESSA